MSRFYFQDNRFRMNTKPGSTLAFFTFVDNETGLEYQDWKLVEGRNGPFVGSPSGKPYTPKGESKLVYPSLVQPSYDPDAKHNRNPKGAKWLAELGEAAYAKYCDLTGKSGQSETKKQSARGPVPAPVGPQDGPDDDLPF